MVDMTYIKSLTEWKVDGGPRPQNRPDGIPTRADHHWHTPAEEAICEAMTAIEKLGASEDLTEALMLLAKARNRVADHVEYRGVSSENA